MLNFVSLFVLFKLCPSKYKRMATCRESSPQIFIDEKIGFPYYFYDDLLNNNIYSCPLPRKRERYTRKYVRKSHGTRSKQTHVKNMDEEEEGLLLLN